MKILHILYQSVPNIAGSSTRSKFIVENQKKKGIEPFVISSPVQCPQCEDQNIKKEEINGITYYRTFKPDKNAQDFVHKKNPLLRVKKFFKMFTFFSEIYRVAKEVKPDVIHAHAMSFCGLPGYLVSRIIKVPFVYEYRSTWEDNVAASGGFRYGSWQHRILGFLENITFRVADHIICINDDLGKNVSQRTGGKKPISIVPNSVDLDFFVPLPKNEKLAESLQLDESVVIGYIGSFLHLEGLEYALEALTKIEQPEIKFLLVGDGNYSDKLKDFVREKGLEQKVVFTGKVPFENILAYYSIIDIFILPRINSVTGRTVTPLKPLEAMACKKIVMASDLPPMREFITDQETGVLFKAEDSQDIADKLKEVINNRSRYNQISENGFHWLKKHKSWLKSAEVYADIYQNLLKKRQNAD